MSYIVYDLEMTVRRKKGQVAEIIEIGAVKLKLEDGAPKLAGTFQSFVRPVIVPQLSADTTAFTGITQQDVNGAGTLAEAIRSWVEWMGPEQYFLIAWGPDDHRQLVQECRHHGISTDWILNHNNLQKMLSKAFKLEKHQQLGLKPALEMLELPFSGSHHRALDDALNTAQIFTKLFDQLQFRRNKISEEAKVETEVVYKTEHFENLPFAGLARLLPEAKPPRHED
ncbi:exonuclease domain-containing protein [Cohnella pontilimi]|uniref:Exonuclease domain-containing protein n=1 Tax=Cohnella pontilimi TaxID=2564100 RepID=A0A4U0FGI4_9BACL|nr:3'-5' exonuclease [Cohnella pontilimi]TJY43504.1 exonuclease domain-containing protein [Cohnella pontilimi]